MLLAGVAVACGRGFLPLDQALFTLGLGQSGRRIPRSANFERHHWPDQARQFLARKMRSCYGTRIQIRSPGYSQCINSRNALPRAICAAGLSPRSSES